MALNIQNEWSKIKNKKSNEWSKIMLVLSKGCKDARYDKCQPISTIIWTLIKKNCGRLPDIPSWSRTFHVGSVPIVSKSIASSNSPKSSFPLTIVNTVSFHMLSKLKQAQSTKEIACSEQLCFLSRAGLCLGQIAAKNNQACFWLNHTFRVLFIPNGMYGEPDGLSDPSCPYDLSHRLAWGTVLYIVIICNFNVEKITM